MLGVRGGGEEEVGTFRNYFQFKSPNRSTIEIAAGIEFTVVKYSLSALKAIFQSLAKQLCIDMGTLQRQVGQVKRDSQL